MKSQKYNHITRVLVAVGLFSMASRRWPLRYRRERRWPRSRNWSEITAASRRRWIRIKWKATLKTTLSAIFLKGWSAYRQQERLSPAGGEVGE
jgi:hypothetical protein